MGLKCPAKAGRPVIAVSGVCRGTFQRGAYASIRAPRNTPTPVLKRAQGDHESYESSRDDRPRPDR
ncbi:hypothetical protein CXK90_17255 [Stutzerimonas stutzeri]|nr:hypothetical protein CXK90_17255 [Stutzerimonas stutzeri]